MANAVNELVKNSVTRGEAEYYGGIISLWMQNFASTPMVSLAYDPPPYWSAGRDTTLRSAVKAEGLWATCINIATARVASLGYDVSGDVPLRVRKAREMVGRNWVTLIQLTVQDWASNDNGAFWEVVRAAKGPGAKCIGFLPLSSARCIRTGNVEVPVIYADRLGVYHELKAHQVVSFAEMPNDDYYGVGYCATSRAYEHIYERLSVSRYFKEKATGRRALSLQIIKGFPDKLIEGGIRAAETKATQKGAINYMGNVIIADPNPNPLSKIEIAFASIPDWFKADEHERQTKLRYAAHLGIDAADIDPTLITNSLGSGAQARVMDEKQDSKGAMTLRQQIVAFMNDTEQWHPLPGATTFRFSERDLRDQQVKAGIAKTQTDTWAAMVAATIITTDEARQLAVDAGVLPVSMLKVDTTNEETLSDEDKPYTENDALPNALGAPAPSASPSGDAATRVAQILAPITRKALTEKSHTGAIIALMMPPDVVKAVGGVYPLPPDVAQELHCTLIFLGDAEELATQRADIEAMVQQIAQSNQPFEGNINGHGVFATAPDTGKKPLFANLDAPALPELRGKMMEALKGMGWVQPKPAHGFTPHVTLDYLDSKDDATPPNYEPINTRFDGVYVLWRGAPSFYPFQGVSTKAGATKLATLLFQPDLAEQRGLSGEREVAFWKRATKQLRELGRVWEVAANQHVPQKEGETARTIKARITAPNSPFVTLRMTVGNMQRPEVAVRAVLYGRNAIVAKRKVLRFQVGSKTVFARAVRGTVQNDWFTKSLRDIRPHLSAIEKNLGSVAFAQKIGVGDIDGAKVHRTAQPIPTSKRK